jgi:hypothetical protein
MNNSLIFSALGAILLCFVGGLGMGISVGVHQTRLDAARSGVGEFRLVEKTNNQIKFFWITSTNTATNK